MWITCQIESRDMRGAKRNKCSRCPASKCLNRHLDSKWLAYILVQYEIGLKIAILDEKVLKADNGFTLGDAAWVIPVPLALAKWINAYDVSEPGRPPKPVAFKVNIPKRFLRKEPVAP
jgi:hypothetical protein